MTSVLRGLRNQELARVPTRALSLAAGELVGGDVTQPGLGRIGRAALLTVGYSRRTQAIYWRDVPC